MELRLGYFVIFLGLVSSVFCDEEDSGKTKKEKDNVGTVIGIDLGTTYSWLVNRLNILLINNDVALSNWCY